MILSDKDIYARTEWYDPVRMKKYWGKEPYTEGQLAIQKAKGLAIVPFHTNAPRSHGMSYGLSCAGYDIRLGQHPNPDDENYLLPPGGFILCSSLERIMMPHDLVAIVHDKSSWARRGLAMQNTVLEPGWRGYITLELSNHGKENIILEKGMPIAQLLFHQVSSPVMNPYNGKYQDQEDKPVEWKHEA